MICNQYKSAQYSISLPHPNIWFEIKVGFSAIGFFKSKPCCLNILDTVNSCRFYFWSRVDPNILGQILGKTYISWRRSNWELKCYSRKKIWTQFLKKGKSWNMTPQWKEKQILLLRALWSRISAICTADQWYIAYQLLHYPDTITIWGGEYKSKVSQQCKKYKITK